MQQRLEEYYRELESGSAAKAIEKLKQTLRLYGSYASFINQ